MLYAHKLFYLLNPIVIQIKRVYWVIRYCLFWHLVLLIPRTSICFAIKSSLLCKRLNCCNQRWSRGHKARGQGHKKIRGQGQGQPFRGQTLSRPRTGMLEAKAKDQGHKRKCSPKKKRSSQKFFKRSPRKNFFQKIFQALHKILTIQKMLLSSSRGQANFRGLEASRPRPRTSKCVLEAKNVLEDSTSGCNLSQACNQDFAKRGELLLL